jgi:hypothetical protein
MVTSDKMSRDKKTFAWLNSYRGFEVYLSFIYYFNILNINIKLFT